jgi:hypothetical protein
MNVIIEWINQLLTPLEPIDNICKMNNLNKCVKIKT